jgi:hypothetical protein
MNRLNIVILSSVAFLFAGCFQSPQPQTVDLSDLSIPAVPTLLRSPKVQGVKSYPAHGTLTHRIIHLKNWHVVSKEMFAADVRDLANEPVSDNEIDRLYEEHLDNVELLQEEQKRLLRHLIQNHGLKRVYYEGLTDENKPLFEMKIEAYAAAQIDAAEITRDSEEILAETDDPELRKQLEDLLRDRRMFLLEMGAAGQLLMSGELEGVLPVEDARLYEKAKNPLSEDGHIELESETIEAREDAMVNKMLDSGLFAFMVLDGGHDLSDNIERFGGGTCEYLTVETEWYSQLGGLAGAE